VLLVHAEVEHVHQVVGNWEFLGSILKSYSKEGEVGCGEYCFSKRVCDEWNRLPGEVVSAGSIDSFKGRLNQYFRYIRGFK